MNQPPNSGFEIGEFGIRYKEGRSLAATALFLIAAIVGLGSLWGMTAAFEWQPMRLGLAWPALAALVFASFAMLMLTLAIAPPQNLTFSATHRRVCGYARRRFGVARHLRIEFKSLHSPQLAPFTQESGETFYQLRVGMARQPPLLLGAFPELDVAQLWCDRLTTLIENGSQRP